MRFANGKGLNGQGGDYCLSQPHNDAQARSLLGAEPILATIEHTSSSDGGSTDGTLEVLRAHAADPPPASEPADGGPYDALQQRVGAGHQDVIGFLHADDVYATPDALAHVARA